MRQSVAVVVLVAVAFGLTYVDHAPLIPLLKAEFGLDDLRAGLLSTALFTAYLIVTIATAGLPGRMAPKPLVAAGLLCSIVGTGLLAVSPAYAAALTGKVLQGTGSALSFVAATRYLVGLYGTRRSHFALGLYGAGFPLGGALSVAIMPTLAALLGGWHEAIATEAGFLVVVLVLWMRIPAVPALRAPGDMRDAMRCANCWLTFVQHAAGFGLGISSATWIAVYLVREFDLPLVVAGALGSLLLIVTMGGRTVGGLLVAREHLRTTIVMRVGTLLIVAGVALLALPGRPLLIALAGAIVVGTGVGLPYAAVFNTAAASLPRSPGAAQGLAAIGGTTGVMIGAPMMGYAVQTYGFSAAWLFVAGVAALAFGTSFLMRGEEELLGAGA